MRSRQSLREDAQAGVAAGRRGARSRTASSGTSDRLEVAERRDEGERRRRPSAGDDDQGTPSRRRVPPRRSAPGRSAPAERAEQPPMRRRQPLRPSRRPAGRCRCRRRPPAAAAMPSVSAERGPRDQRADRDARRRRRGRRRRRSSTTSPWRNEADAVTSCSDPVSISRASAGSIGCRRPASRRITARPNSAARAPSITRWSNVTAIVPDPPDDDLAVADDRARRDPADAEDRRPRGS